MVKFRSSSTWIAPVVVAGTLVACVEPTTEQEDQSIDEDTYPADEAIDSAHEAADSADEATDAIDEDTDALGIPDLDPQSGWGSLCRAACWGAAALGCSAVSVACAGATTITIGGTAIPCSWAIIGACTAGAAGGSLCSDKCPP